MTSVDWTLRYGRHSMSQAARNAMKSLTLLGFATSLLSGAAFAGEAVSRDGGLLTSGWAEAWGGYSFVDPLSSSSASCSGCAPDISDDGYPVFGGAARANLPLGKTLSVQLDIEGQNNFTNKSAGTANYHYSFGGGGHLSYRRPDRYLVGVFAAGGEAEGGGSSGEGPVPFWLAGAEGQYYLDDFTLYGQAGYLDSSDNQDDNFQRAFFLRGVGRYFPTDHSKVTVDLQFATGDMDDSCGGSPYCDGHMFSWVARYDRAISESQFSWFVAYRGFTNAKDGGGERDRAIENTILAGLRVAIGTSSLKSEDRRGATLDLPDAGRWVGYSTDVLD